MRRSIPPVHSRYERRLADVAAGGQEVLIHLQVRRFSCGNDACERRTFAEQVPGLAGGHARRTTGLGETLARWRSRWAAGPARG